MTAYPKSGLFTFHGLQTVHAVQLTAHDIQNVAAHGIHGTPRTLVDGDWLITTELGNVYGFPDDFFRSRYTPVEAVTP
jgi:hypothetical protein